MHVFLNAPCQSLLFEHHADAYVQALVVVAERVVISVLDVPSCIRSIEFCIDTFLDVFLVQIFQWVVASFQIDGRTQVASFVDELERSYSRCFRHPCVIRTEGRRDMDDTGTVFRGNVVTANDAECVSVHCEEWYELFIVQSDQVLALQFGHDFALWQFLAVAEVGIDELLGKDEHSLLSVVWVGGFYHRIVQFWTDTESRVGGQGPWGRGPCQHPCLPFFRGSAQGFWQTAVFRRLQTELGGDGRVLYVAVASRLVQLV